MNKRHAQGGFALIEVLVSMVIIVASLFGVAGLLMVSQKTGSSAGIKMQATQAAYDILDAMKANRSAISSYGIAATPATPTAPSSSNDCVQNACSPTALANYDLWYWESQALSKLPQGKGSISVQQTGANNMATYQVTVTVSWNDSASSFRVGKVAQQAGSSSGAGASAPVSGTGAAGGSSTQQVQLITMIAAA